MNTLQNTPQRKIKSVEVKMSNMTFVVECHTHYITARHSGWARNRYTAKIKENGQGIGVMGDRNMIRSQMANINSKPHLFLK